MRRDVRALNSTELDVCRPTPLVSVGLPVRNGEHFLAEALDGLLAQEDSCLEILVSDNASTDGTQEIARDYASKFASIRYHRSSEDIGPFANFALVLERASGGYFMWAAHDDLRDPPFVGAMVRLLADDPAAVLAFCNFDNIDARGNSIREYPHISELFGQGPVRERMERLIWFEECMGKANLVYGLHRTEILRSCGGMRAYGRGDWGIDYLLVYRLAARGHFVFDERRLFHKRLPSQTPQNPLPRGALSPARQIAGYFRNSDTVLREAPLSNEDRRWLRKSLRRRKAGGIA
jgi:glycosyltransferase involved in cell wall biosynthesis